MPAYVADAPTRSGRTDDEPCRGAAKAPGVEMTGTINAQAQPFVDQPTFLMHQTAAEIAYRPEGALSQGVAMVKALEFTVKKLDLGSRLRKEVWQREIDKYVAYVKV